MLTGVVLARPTEPTSVMRGTRGVACAAKPRARMAQQARRASPRPLVRANALDLTSFGVALVLSFLVTSVRPTLALAAERSTTSPPSGLPVTTAEVRQRCFTETLETAGRLVPRQEILVRPEIEGLRIAQVLVEDGDRVADGQVLARLSRPDGQSGPLPSTATIKSPAAGVISFRAAENRATATVRGEPLFRLIAGGELELQAEVPATRLSKLAPGQSATIEIPGMVEPISGRVRSVASAIDPKTQMAVARIFLGDRRLPVGTFAKAIVIVGQRCGASVPLSSVIYRTEGPIVQVVRNNRIETKRVQVGLLSGGDIEILDGLKDGEMVVVRSGAFLREGDAVRVVVPKEQPAQFR
jgi:HlyD family secretion protein